MNFIVTDFETSKWTRFVVGGIYDGYHFTHFTKLKKLLAFLFDNYAGKSVFAHFGGRFDFLFILEEAWDDTNYVIHPIIPRGSGILCFDIERVSDGRKVTFRDSSALFPFALAKITKDFGVTHKKKSFDYDSIDKVTPELLEYLEYDLKGLYEAIEKFYSWDLIEKVGGATTLASQSMRVLRYFLKTDIYGLSQRMDARIRPSYFGGRTEIFRPYYDGEKPLHCFDCNSLYPTVMRAHEYPNEFENITYDYHEEKLGFYECDVVVPPMKYPPLPVMGEVNGSRKLLFPTGSFSGTYTTAEINYAIQLGCKFKFHRGYIFSSAGFLFRDFVDSLYEIRKRSAKDSVDNVVTKLLLNSCYGRFGLSYNRENIVLDDGSAGLKPLREVTIRGRRMVLATKSVDVKSFSNVAIASFVTSYARIHMHKIFSKLGDDLYYSDTDSVFTTADLGDSSDLGAMKHEYSCKSAVFLLPKTYRAGDKVVMKGFDKKKIQHFTHQDFMECLRGDLKRLKIIQEPKFATLKTAIRCGQFVAMTKKSTRQIRTIYDKRLINLKNNTSSPLELDKGRVINK